ncbi:S1 family peptidase [Micromonospora sp. NPDC050417]|uniref:S1 family peptidase n=1 Tax=Micromonospora sp. NPDC050417 TaxID=3364280 RepID=UPI00379DF09B
MNTRPIRLMAVAASAVLLAGVAFAAPAGAREAKSAPAADTGAVAAAVRAYQSSYPQMSTAAARAAFAQQLDRKKVYERVAADTATYGGAWFDPPTGLMHLSATTSAAASAAAKAAKDLGVRAETHVVSRSWAQLEQQAAALRAGTDGLARAAKGQVGIDVKTNSVVVAVPTGTLSTARTAAPAGVSVIADPNIQTEADAGCTSRLDCDWTVRAGAVLKYNGSGTCSVGFTARNASAQRFVYTAGHCNSGGGTWSTGAQNIGPMTNSLQSGAIDAGIIRVDNSWFQYDSGGEIYAENANHSVALNYVAPTTGYLLVGETVCLSANFTEINGPNYCGTIGSTSDAAVLGMVRVDGFDACGGDSGGGWYWLSSATYRVAYGIHSRSDAGCHGSSGGTRSWFGSIPLVTPLWGLTIETRAS